MFKIYKFIRFFKSEFNKSRKKIIDFSNIINDKYIYWQKLRSKLIIHFFYLLFIDIYIYIFIIYWFGFNIISQIFSIKNYWELNTNVFIKKIN